MTSTNTKKTKILIVEDDLFLTDIYFTKFEQAGYEIDVAQDGKNGLDKVKEFKPDVILLDLAIPEFDGFELLEEIKKDNNLKDIPTIVFSNKSAPEDLERAEKLGAAGYIIKSQYTPSEVVVKVEEIIKK